MSDTSDDEPEISFKIKFLGRVEVVRPTGAELLEEAVKSLQMPDPYSSEKVAKKSKVHLFLSRNGIDLLEHETMFLLYQCPLFTVSFCAILPSSPKIFGYVAKHPAADTYHCYLFQSKKFSHVVVSAIGDAFKASNQDEGTRGRYLIVEALKHKNKILERENEELKRRLQQLSN